MRRIRVSNGQYAIVDQKFYTQLRELGKWTFCRGYAITQAPRRKGHPRRTLRMHRVVWELAGRPAVPELDHRDNNGLNNRLTNLRPATKSQNAANRGRLNRRKKTSRYRGVSKTPWGWQAKIVVHGRSRSIGYFEKEHDAARAYDREARRAWGDYANLNCQQP